jgi:polysaccharide deacetylase family protein (PEP-CTERM system associated)
MFVIPLRSRAAIFNGIVVLEHFFTVDVEEHFQVSAFDSIISRSDWATLPGRLDRTVPVLLENLERFGARGTFFCLGWVAQHRPDVVRRIAAAGHEVASHGFWHHRVHTLSPDAFRDDIRSSKRALEDLVGQPVRGYRAPSFSIVRGTEWAFDVLLEEGFAYDSSVFPIQRHGYGYAGASTEPHVIERPAGRLAEFPLATASVLGLNVPAAGGGYLRQFPFWVVRRAFRQALARGVPATFYIHPWEIDPEQPRFPVGLLTRVRHYRGLADTLARIRRLLQGFRFTSIASYLDSTSLTLVSEAYG